MNHPHWAEVEGFPGYKVSSQGDVVTPRGVTLVPYSGRYGHQQVLLGAYGKRQCKTVHSLVCAAFNGPKPSVQHQCAHRDGNPRNNVPGNLYWATAKQNADDREAHGRTARGDRSGPRIHRHKMRRGEKHPRAKLTEQEVSAIKAIPKVRGDTRLIAEVFKVSPSLVNQIRRGAIWKP